MPSDNLSLTELEKTLRAILLSTYEAQSAEQIKESFQELTFTKLDCHSYGFDTMDALLGSFYQSVQLFSRINGIILYKGVPDKNTISISLMVKNQKKSARPSNKSNKTKVKAIPSTNPKHPATFSAVSTKEKAISQNTKGIRTLSEVHLIHTPKTVENQQKIRQTQADEVLKPAVIVTTLKTSQPTTNTPIVTDTKKPALQINTSGSKKTRKNQLNLQQIIHLRLHCLKILKRNAEGITIKCFLEEYEKIMRKPLDCLKFEAKNIIDLFDKYTYDIMEIDFNSNFIDPTLKKKYLPPLIITHK